MVAFALLCFTSLYQAAESSLPAEPTAIAQARDQLAKADAPIHLRVRHCLVDQYLKSGSMNAVDYSLIRLNGLQLLADYKGAAESASALVSKNDFYWHYSDPPREPRLYGARVEARGPPLSWLAERGFHLNTANDKLDVFATQYRELRRLCAVVTKREIDGLSVFLLKAPNGREVVLAATDRFLQVRAPSTERRNDLPILELSVDDTPGATAQAEFRQRLDAYANSTDPVPTPMKATDSMADFFAHGPRVSSAPPLAFSKKEALALCDELGMLYPSGIDELVLNHWKYQHGFTLRLRAKPDSKVTYDIEQYVPERLRGKELVEYLNFAMKKQRKLQGFHVALIEDNGTKYVYYIHETGMLMVKNAAFEDAELDALILRFKKPQSK